MCSFIIKVKRKELSSAAEQKQYLEEMPRKAAGALRYYMKDKPNGFADFEIRNDKLFLVELDQLKAPRLRLVLPARLRIRILTANHDAAAAGHRGFKKTYTALTKLYFWFGMYSDTKAWIKSCVACGKGKRRTIAGHGTARHMGLVPTKYPPFDRVVVDLIGPLPESRDGMKYILVEWTRTAAIRRTLQTSCWSTLFSRKDVRDRGKAIARRSSSQEQSPSSPVSRASKRKHAAHIRRTRKDEWSVETGWWK